MRFKPGDVVLVKFPWENSDGSVDFKVRPAVVWSIEGPQERLMIQVTTKNRSAKLPGVWIKKDSPEGKKMGLLMDSFINVGTQKEVRFIDITRLIGQCSEALMDRLEEEIDRL